MEDQLAKRLVQSLKDAGINFVTYLPETRLSQIIPLIQDDPAKTPASMFQATVCSR
jgi:sulfopyruvate decarboxylase TPP-binding subunit